MKITQLKYLLQIHQSGSMYQAANVLGITHAALSIAVSSLEKELDMKLLYRSRHGCILTPDGQKVVAAAKRIEEQLQQLEDLKQDWKEKNTITIASLSQTMSTIIHYINYNFEHEYPSSRLFLNEYFRDSIENVQNRQKFDFLFFLDYAHPFSHYQECADLLFSSDYVICLASEHPLARKKQMSLNDIAEKYHLLVYADSSLPVPYLEQISSCDYLNRIGTIKNILDEKNCVALIPKLFLSSPFFAFNQNFQNIPVTDVHLKLNGYVLSSNRNVQSLMKLTYQSYLHDFLFAQ